MVSLAKEELVSRAKALRLVLSDVDGVQTDAGVYYGERGELMKRFSVRDGMGVERLRNDGVETGFITREKSPSVQKRAEKLRLVHCLLGIRDKTTELSRLQREQGFELYQLGYIGDDVNDLGVLSVIGEQGLTAAPADALPEVKKAVHYVCDKPGGHGAFRDFAEWLLELRRTT